MILIACEYSGTVRDAFIALGHDAISCDLLPTDKPGPHIVGDCKAVIASRQWDLIIMHPPCTALTVAGNSTYGEGRPKYQNRLASVAWTKDLWEIACNHSPRVCMENPVGILPRLAGLVPAQYIQPWMFGHMETKKTGLWLHGLPVLSETNNVWWEAMRLPKRERQRLHYMPPSPDRWKIRSTTYQGIADAMAAQWSKLL
jgi:site-specific DNA-cytosine methylase